jgi:hypothetical protein
MRRTQLLCAIGVSLWWAIACASQATGGGAISAALRAHLQNEQFGIVTSVRGLPLGVRDQLQTLFGSGLDIAEPGAEFQATAAAATSKLPLRRLIAAGCSNDFHCLVYYERGGSDHTWHVVLFHWSPDATKFEWGGVAPSSLKTINDVRNAILSGVVKGQTKVW